MLHEFVNLVGVVKSTCTLYAAQLEYHNVNLVNVNLLNTKPSVLKLIILCIQRNVQTLINIVTVGL